MSYTRFFVYLASIHLAHIRLSKTVAKYMRLRRCSFIIKVIFARYTESTAPNTTCVNGLTGNANNIVSQITAMFRSSRIHIMTSMILLFIRLINSHSSVFIAAIFQDVHIH